MAINTNSQYNERGGIRSETNVQGQWLDAEDANALLAHQAHSEHDTNCPWSKSYRPADDSIWVEESIPVEPSPEIEAANRKDLKSRNIYTNS